MCIRDRFPAALEHAHRHTSYNDAVVKEPGRTATQQVAVNPPKPTDRPLPLPLDCRVPRGQGGGGYDVFFTILLSMTGYLWRCSGGPMVGDVDARRRLWRRTISDCSGRCLHGIPRYVSCKTSSWDTVLCVLGWDIDTVATTISVPVSKMERLRDMLREWPSDQEVASENEMRSLIARLLHLCEGVRP